ncbi:hypothetical protein THTE_1781 [Thermogutta terrifontis]|uniref:Uncharacterized protein n=1 Tax=Thermogutta terrifontis TaxID=1331910 RepID=A0A286REL2_9BACT|nr:hypothetical protein THTE_1781 [Thermogutta terrifontis]
MTIEKRSALAVWPKRRRRVSASTWGRCGGLHQRLTVQTATATSLNTIGLALQKKLAKVVLESWPRLWHNLRASCESDLAQAFPLAVITKWLGNSPSIALRRYLDPADAAYAQALNWMPPHESGQMNTGSVQTNSRTESGARVAEKAVQNIPALVDKIVKSESQNLFNRHVMQLGARRNLLLQTNLMEMIGLEPTTSCLQSRRSPN